MPRLCSYPLSGLTAGDSTLLASMSTLPSLMSSANHILIASSTSTDNPLNRAMRRGWNSKSNKPTQWYDIGDNPGYLIHCTIINTYTYILAGVVVHMLGSQLMIPIPAEAATRASRTEVSSALE